MLFSDLIGQTISAVIPKAHPTIFQRVKVRGVEAGGLWIESQSFTNALLQAAGLSASDKTVVLFLPWNEFSIVMTYVDEVSLDEKSFGV
jgi:hypothetical protein